jgi:hypothetical protein
MWSNFKYIYFPTCFICSFAYLIIVCANFRHFIYMTHKQRGTVATVPQPTTQNYVNYHYFMALSHTFYVIKYSPKDSCLFINLEIRLGPNVLFLLLLLFLSKFRMQRRCKGLRRNTRTFIIQRSCEDWRCTLAFHARCERSKIWIDVINLHLFLLFRLSLCS